MGFMLKNIITYNKKIRLNYKIMLNIINKPIFNYILLAKISSNY